MRREAMMRALSAQGKTGASKRASRCRAQSERRTELRSARTQSRQEKTLTDLAVQDGECIDNLLAVVGSRRKHAAVRTHGRACAIDVGVSVAHAKQILMLSTGVRTDLPTNIDTGSRNRGGHSRARRWSRDGGAARGRGGRDGARTGTDAARTCRRARGRSSARASAQGGGRGRSSRETAVRVSTCTCTGSSARPSACAGASAARGRGREEAAERPVAGEGLQVERRVPHRD